MQWLEKLNSFRGLLVTGLVLAIAVIGWLKLPQLTRIAFDFGNAEPNVSAPRSPSTGTPSAEPDSMKVSIANVEACPVAFSLPCYLMVEIRNNSNRYPADPSVVIDPGSARIIDYELRPTFDSTVDVDSVGSVVRINRQALPAGGALRFYAQTDGASTPQVWLYIGSELRAHVARTGNRSGRPGPIVTIFGVLFFIAFIVVGIVLLVALVQYLSRVLKIQW